MRDNLWLVGEETVKVRAERLQQEASCSEGIGDRPVGKGKARYWHWWGFRGLFIKCERSTRWNGDWWSKFL